MTPLPDLLSKGEGLPDDVLRDVTSALVAGDALPDVARAWVPDGPSAAEWAMHKLTDAQARIHAVREQAAVWRARIDSWEADESRADVHTVAFFDGVLQRWAQLQRETDASKATYRLPSGEVATTLRGARITITDSDALVAWCKDNAPDAVHVTVTEKVTVTEAKKLGEIVEHEIVTGSGETVSVHRAFVSPDGEPVPGIDVLAPELSATVRTAWT